jgi:DNA-binding SARP family transcriptional activator
MLFVTLLGGASFSANGALIRSDLGPAGRLLACYLFEFAGRVHRRERLADLFWGESDPDKARSALNTAIWRIRKMLELGSKGGGRHLITSGDDIVLEHSQSVCVDAHQLENASRRVLNRLNGGVLTDADAQDVSVAVSAYAGPFLEGQDGDWVLRNARDSIVYLSAALSS